MEPELRSLARGRFLELVEQSHWEYVRRVRGSTPVGIVAVTDEGYLILITQYRVPVGRVCVEIPAGLVGDGNSAEDWKSAALRELREETGYAACDVAELTEGPTSAGLTSECIRLVRAVGVTRAGVPQPDGDERIEVHAVPLARVEDFLARRVARGELVDPKVYAALYFAGRR